MMWLFIFSLLFSCTGSSDIGNVLKITPPVAAVRFGDPLSANCSATETSVTGMGWESTHGGIGLKEGVSSLPFKLDKVEDWKMDDPLCYATLTNDEQITERLKVIVYKMPEKVYLSRPGSKLGSMVEGQQYDIACTAVDVAPVDGLYVFWYKGNQIFHNETFNEQEKTPATKSSVLKVRAHRDDNGKKIWCEAMLNLKSSVPNPPKVQSPPHEMNVFYPPTFSRPENETLDVPPGKQMALNCTATGNPTPVYTWHFSDSTEETSTMIQNVNEPILTSSLKHSGIYHCKASNELSGSTKSFTVVVARDRTTFGAILGGCLALGALLGIAGLIFVKSDGSFSFNRGNSNSSGPL